MKRYQFVNNQISEGQAGIYLETIMIDGNWMPVILPYNFCIEHRN